MIDFGNLSRSEVEKLIDEYIFSERDRKILKRRLLDGIRFEPLEEPSYSVIQKLAWLYIVRDHIDKEL